MQPSPSTVEQHYARGAILERILNALQAAGKDLARLTSADLAPVDQFHMRGREASIELAARAALRVGARVLDVGCGLGGVARYLASEHRCQVTGIDLTHAYIEAAQALTELVEMQAAIVFRQASALELPFDLASFDVVWTEHVQMNIADKARFYAQIARVLVPGGQLLFHDVFQGEGGTPFYPVPWADDPTISFLAKPDEVRGHLADAGLHIVDWADTTGRSLEWLRATGSRAKAAGPRPLGLHLLMGANAREKFDNNMRNLSEGRVCIVQGIARRR